MPRSTVSFMTHSRWIRIALGYLSLQNLQLGLWALLAPRSFYDGFPGLGRAWISSDGPFNEHLIRDFGALNLAVLVVFVAAAVSLSRPMVLTAAGAAWCGEFHICSTTSSTPTAWSPPPISP